ncbi:MAG: Bax inhibitor-1/YccA family protein [Desulfovibrionaceae bacterium]|jgi:FtsH-binding integral membrane protein
MYPHNSSYPATGARAEIVNAFMRGVYGWMAGGLALTAVVAWATLNTPLASLVFQMNPQTGAIGMSPIVWVLFLVELGIVFYLSARIQQMQASTATSLFLVYSGLNGLTLSPILLAYTAASVASTFVVTAGMFGAMSLYGLVTKKDLTSWGSLLFMGLIGIILATVVNIFIGSPAINFAISVIGVLIFLGLTAYDTQKLKIMGETAPAGGDAVRKVSILGALTLYLDFINLFLFLLRFMGASRE